MPCGLGAAFKCHTIISAGLSGARLKDSTVLLTRVSRNYQAWVRFIGTTENSIHGRTNLTVKLQSPHSPNKVVLKLKSREM